MKKIISSLFVSIFLLLVLSTSAFAAPELKISVLGETGEPGVGSYQLPGVGSTVTLEAVLFNGSTPLQPQQECTWVSSVPSVISIQNQGMYDGEARCNIKAVSNNNGNPITITASTTANGQTCNANISITVLTTTETITDFQLNPNPKEIYSSRANSYTLPVDQINPGKAAPLIEWGADNWANLAPGVSYNINTTAEKGGTNTLIIYADKVPNGRYNIWATAGSIIRRYTLDITTSTYNPNQQPSTPTNPNLSSDGSVYRLYNRITGEHLYTTDVNEVAALTQGDWNNEGVAWHSATSGEGVYRLYSPVTHAHLFTSDQNEITTLPTQGWQIDNNGQPLFYSGGTKTIYRLYNPAIRMHLLTLDTNEYNVLPTQGWQQEGPKFLGN